MSVSLTTVLLSAALSQAPGGQAAGPTPVRASLEQPTAFVNRGAPAGADQFERGLGSATFDVLDRVAGEAAPWGDTGTVSAEVRTGAGTWGIELTQVGFPREAAGLAPPFAVQGGVVRDVALHGGAPRGYAAFPRARAAAAVWGLGTVRFNGRVVAERVPVYAAALVEGFHADDDTHRVLLGGRALDAELHVVALAVPQSVDARGFVELSFDDVRIEAGGQSLRTAARVDTTVAPTQPGGTAVAATSAVGLPGPQQTGVGGAGTAGTGADPGALPAGSASGPSAQQATGLVRTPDPLTIRAGTSLVTTPAPANATPGAPLPLAPTPLTATPATALPGSTTPALPGNTPASALPAGPGTPFAPVAPGAPALPVTPAPAVPATP